MLASMITVANKGKTLIYIYYNRETKPETFLASQGREEFAKVMFLGDELGVGCGGEGGSESICSPMSHCSPHSPCGPGDRLRERGDGADSARRLGAERACLLLHPPLSFQKDGGLGLCLLIRSLLDHVETAK